MMDKDFVFIDDKGKEHEPGCRIEENVAGYPKLPDPSVPHDQERFLVESARWHERNVVHGRRRRNIAIGASEPIY